MQQYLEQFTPYPGMPLEINASAFICAPDPLFQDGDVVFARQGTEATLYQLREQATGSLWALKVFHPGFNAPYLQDEAYALSQFTGLPGLSCARRHCLTRTNAPMMIARYPMLEYAMLMPWISGRLWAGFMLDRTASAGYTPALALSLARLLASALGHLEVNGIAHTDIAGGNILFSPTWDKVELVDIERMFLPGGPRPVVVSHGSPGYAFPKQDAQGQWRKDGDRFSGAIALVEILAWADPAVRAVTSVESDTLFDDSDLQALTSERWQRARDAIWAICPPALALFDQAWNARDLSECPAMAEWAFALNTTQSAGM